MSRNVYSMFDPDVDGVTSREGCVSRNDNLLTDKAGESGVTSREGCVSRNRPRIRRR